MTIKTKVLLLCVLCVAVSACAKHDPVLPGTRMSVFEEDLTIHDKPVPTDVLSRAIATKIEPMVKSPYVQSTDNIISETLDGVGPRLIFSGFPTTAHVSGKRTPVFKNGFVYAGLSTGEAVKINPKSRDVKWIADIYKSSSLTGGSDIMDIVAPIIIDGGYVYVGGLGGAFCKIKDSTGVKTWCDWISVSTPFSIHGELAFVIGTDEYLYIINTDNGDIYSRHKMKCTTAPDLVTESGEYFIKCNDEKPTKIRL